MKAGSAAFQRWEETVLKNAIIAALVLCLFVVTNALVRIENQRYALITGMCPAAAQSLAAGDPLETSRCLERAETRTSWVWHVYYAVFTN
jgi:hypothetical protein